MDTIYHSNGSFLGVIADDEVDFANVETLFPNTCGDKHIKLIILELLNDLAEQYGELFPQID